MDVTDESSWFDVRGLTAFRSMMGRGCYGSNPSVLAHRAAYRQEFVNRDICHYYVENLVAADRELPRHGITSNFHRRVLGVGLVEDPPAAFTGSIDHPRVPLNGHHLSSMFWSKVAEEIVYYCLAQVGGTQTFNVDLKDALPDILVETAGVSHPTIMVEEKHHRPRNLKLDATDSVPLRQSAGQNESEIIICYRRSIDSSPAVARGDGFDRRLTSVRRRGPQKNEA